MGMVGAGVHLKLAQLLGAEAIMWKHALDRAADDLFRSSLEEVTEGLLLVALGIAAVAGVDLALELVARHGDPLRVEHDHVVAAIEVGLVCRLVLALEHARDARRKTAERLVGRIHDEPASLDLALTDRHGLRVHRCSRSPFVLSPVRDPPLRATCRRHNPLAGAAGGFIVDPGSASAARTASVSRFPRPTSTRRPTIRRTCPRRNDSARTSMVTYLPDRPTRSAVTVRTGSRSPVPKAVKS